MLESDDYVAIWALWLFRKAFFLGNVDEITGEITTEKCDESFFVFVISTFVVGMVVNPGFYKTTWFSIRGGGGGSGVTD